MQDIRRLMVLAYSSTTSQMWEAVASNAFLDALGDPVLALEIRKRGSSTLDGAYRDALLIEGFLKASMPGNDNGKGSQRANSRAATAKPQDKPGMAESQNKWLPEFRAMKNR